MADQEEDFSKLPLPDRFAHKNWKVRKEGYEAATKEFKTLQPTDPLIREFNDSNIWKAAVADSNVAAQQEGMIALCAFLDAAGTPACTRTRASTVVPLIEKGLTGRPAAKQSATEALLLYIELDKPDPIIEEILPLLSHKLPKLITAALTALTAIYHAYGCKTVEPKPVIKLLPKVFGHADKNVRAEAQNLTVELYRWLKDAMKPLFWNDLKPVQQTDLEKLFDKVKDEPAPKQERLLRSQQEAVEAAAANGVEEPEEEEAEEDDADIDLQPEFEVVDVFPKMPSDLNERLNSSKWKDRKEVLDEVHKAVNHPAIKEGPFDDLVRGLAKSMKDANIGVVTVAANIVELLAKGLGKKGFARYRSTILSPMLERFKEKKQSVTDALAGGLDAVFVATSLNENIEEILEFMKHKNPLVKVESARFLTRCLKTTREAPQPAEVKPIADAAAKFLGESQPATRDAGAEVLGTLWKIMGDRNMLVHLEGLDEIRKTKVKEFCDAAEVKAKWKPKAAPPPKPAAAPAGKKPALGRRPGAPAAAKRPAPPPARPATPPSEPESAPAPLAARPTSRPATKLGGKPGLQAPKTLGLKRPGVAAPGSSIASPKRAPPPPADEDAAPPTPAPRSGLAAPGRSLAARPLGKPLGFSQSTNEYAEPPAPAPAPPTTSSAMSNAERAELSDLRAEAEYLRQQNSDLRTDKMKLNSQIHELQNQNAQLIEDHTRDVLGIKAKETQLVRARSDAEAAEEKAASLAREVERLKREVNRLGRAEREASQHLDNYADHNSNGMNNGNGMRYDSAYDRPSSYARPAVPSFRSHHDRVPSGADLGKENIPDTDNNGDILLSPSQRRTKLSPTFGAAAGVTPASSLSRTGSESRRSVDHSSSGRASPAGGFGGHLPQGASSHQRPGSGFDGGSGAGSASGSVSGSASHSRASMSRGGSDGVESWRRAAEVTQNLKARIEMMKAKQARLASQQH